MERVEVRWKCEKGHTWVERFDAVGGPIIPGDTIVVSDEQNLFYCGSCFRDWIQLTLGQVTPEKMDVIEVDAEEG